MKKVFFSAVALVAFSFAGMANTGGENELVLKDENKTYSKINQYGLKKIKK